MASTTSRVTPYTGASKKKDLFFCSSYYQYQNNPNEIKIGSKLTQPALLSKIKEQKTEVEDRTALTQEEVITYGLIAVGEDKYLSENLIVKILSRSYVRSSDVKYASQSNRSGSRNSSSKRSLHKLNNLIIFAYLTSSDMILATVFRIIDRLIFRPLLACVLLTRNV